jgi:hypothetical protein
MGEALYRRITASLASREGARQFGTDFVVVRDRTPVCWTGKSICERMISVRADPGLSVVTPGLTDQLGCLPDAQLPATEPRAGGHRWLPDIQPPTLDGPAGVSGHPRADLIDHQPRPQGHHPGIDRDGLPRGGPARGRNPLAGMAAHLKDAKLGPTGAGRARRRPRGSRPGCTWRRGRRRIRGTAGDQEDCSRDGVEYSNGWRPQAASVSSRGWHVMVLGQRWAALTVLQAEAKCKPWPLPCESE